MSGGALVFRGGVKQDLGIGVGQVDVPGPAGGTLRADLINLGTFADFKYVEDWVPGGIAAGSYAAVEIDVPGLILPTVTDFELRHVIHAVFNAAAPSPDLIVYGYHMSDDKVRVILRNVGLIPVNPGAGTLIVLVFKV